MAAAALTADSATVQCKTCTKCGEVKPVSEFSRAATGTFGVRGDCRGCRSGYNNRQYAALPYEAKLARGRTPGRKAAVAAWIKKNQEKIREDRRRRWASRDVEESRRIARQMMRRIRATAKGKLQSNVSRALNRALRGRKNGVPSFELLGFSVEELITHLERQFLRGMSWKNYGKWHVDHIRPLASFDYERPTDAGFKDAWALTNLRPLWARENFAKRDQRILLI